MYFAAVPALPGEKLSRKAAVDMSLPPRPHSFSTNFLRKNALAAMQVKPPKVVEPLQDFLVKAEYGRVPKYLHQSKLRMETERRQQEALVVAKHQKVHQY